MNWEYRVVRVSLGPVAEINYAVVAEQELQSLARTGWELVSVANVGNNLLLFAKKPRENQN